jgi:hypothetical protein
MSRPGQRAKDWWLGPAHHWRLQGEEETKKCESIYNHQACACMSQRKKYYTYKGEAPSGSVLHKAQTDSVFGQDNWGRALGYAGHKK